MLKKYLRDKMAIIILFILLQLICIGMCKAFEVKSFCWFTIVFFNTSTFLCVLVFDCNRRVKFYKDFQSKLNNLDKKHLVSEVIQYPGFFEGDILCDYSYEIGKDVRTDKNKRTKDYNDFKEYIEMWIHELKAAISGISIMSYDIKETCDKYMNIVYELEERINNSSTTNVDLYALIEGFSKIKDTVSKQQNPVKKMNFYVEQILFYSRSENASKDYYMKKHILEELVNKVIFDNKNLLLASKIKIEKRDLSYEVITDAKWIEFILGQVVNNSIKYAKDKNNKIEFYGEKREESVILNIKDYGIGISESDIDRVFDKCFTGINGRMEKEDMFSGNVRVSSATGMGLYISKKLCDKLGHKISIRSKKGEYTIVSIEIGLDKFYNDIIK